LEISNQAAGFSVRCGNRHTPLFREYAVYLRAPSIERGQESRDIEEVPQTKRRGKVGAGLLGVERAQERGHELIGPMLTSLIGAGTKRLEGP
jgi:hypothetical protein